MKNLHVRLSASVGEFRTQMGAASRATKDFGREMDKAAASSRESFQQIGKAGVVLGGVIVAGFGAAVMAASKFETSMRNVSTISAATRKDFDGMSASVIDLSRKVPQAASTLADGLYDITSSGFDGAKALQVLEASAVAATAGMTDTATAATVITGVLNAYGKGAEDAARVSDILFQTVNLGVLTFEELAEGAGSWLSTAAALKVPVEDASAALATMTLAGINAAESHTALNRVMSSFIDPSDAMAEQIRKLGYESGEALVQEKGLREAVLMIGEASGGSVSKVADLYGEIRAIKGALALGAAEGENYSRVTEGMADSAGAAADAYELQSKAFSVQLDLAKSSISAFAIEVGTKFLPIASAGAQAVGQMANSLSALPGPAKTGVVVLTGLVGVVALTGGAAMLALPKIVAFRTAMDTIALSGGRAAAGMGALRTGMSALGRFAVAGAVLAVAGAAEVAILNLGKAAHGTPPELEAMSTALAGFAERGKATGVMAEVLGEDLSGLSELMNKANGALVQGGLLGGTDEILAGITGKNPEVEAAKDQIEQLDKALASLMESDPEKGAKAYDRLKDAWVGAGNSAKDLAVEFPEVAAAMDLNDAAAAAAREEFTALKEEAKALGYDLSDTSELAGMASEDLEALAGSTDPVIFAMLEAGTVTKEQAEEMMSALQEFSDSVFQSFAAVTSPMAIYTTALAEMNTANEAAWRESHDSMDGFVEAGSLSLGDFVGSMQETVISTEQFLADIETAIRMGYDPRLISDLLTAGPEEAAPILQSLVSDHSGELVGLVNDTVGALDELNQKAAEMARLTHLATTSSTDQMTRDLSTAMAISQGIMASGGKLSAEALAKELDIGVQEVARIAGAYGITLAAGVNPVLSGMGRPMIAIANKSSWVERNAGGPIPGVGDGDTVPAMLTPGEFVIRKDAVRALGLDKLHKLNHADRAPVRFFAAGGYVDSEGVPAPPSVAHRGNVVGMAGAEVMGHLYEKVKEWVGQNAQVATGSASGLSPQFLGMFNRYNQALGGILRIISGFRSSAQQSVLYARYLAGTGNLAAPPGRSKHERGLAIDHAPRATAGMKGTARGFGLHYPVPGEPWHVEPINVRDRGGPLMPGLTWNGTGKPEMVLPMTPQRFATGGLVASMFPGGPGGEGVSGWDRTQAMHQAGAMGDRTYQQHLRLRLTQFRQFSSEWMSAYQELVRFEEEAEEKRIAAAEDAYQQRREINDNLFALGKLSLRDHVFNLGKRMEREVRYSDEWTALYRERIRVLTDVARQEQEVVDDALSGLNRMLDEQAQVYADMERSRADHHAKLRKLEDDHARSRTDAIAKRSDELNRWVSIEQQAAVTWGNTVGALTRNVADQIDQFTQWQAALADARSRGVSEGVIGMLGLDQGPQALGQLQMFTAATDAEIAALNASVAERQAQAGSQAATEATQSYTELGGMLVDMAERYAEEVEALNERFMADQAELATRLAAIGSEQGRSFGDAIAEGLRSTIPAIRAAALAAQAALNASPSGGVSMAQIASMFDARGVTIASSTESETERLARIAAEVNSGLRTLEAVDRSIARLAEIPQYATGTPWVPRTGIALVHQGERVLSAYDNRSLVAAVAGGQAAPVVNVSIDVDRMQAVIRTEAAGVIDERTVDVQIAGVR